MFGFLKEKLKSWVEKAKDSFKPKKKEEKEIKKIKKEKAEKKKSEKEAKEKQQKEQREVEKILKLEKKQKRKDESIIERKTTEKVVEDIKKENLAIETPEEKFEEVINKGAAKEEQEEKVEEKSGFFSRLRKFFAYEITETEFDDFFSNLEFSLLENNVSLEVIEKIRVNLKKDLVGKEIKKQNFESEITTSLKKAINDILIEPKNIIEEIKSFRKENSNEPYKILFFGINGAGKTTSIAKFASLCQKNNLSVVLAAGDTFRAASIEQLQIHANNLKIKMIKHEYNSDPSAVAFDAIKYAKQNSIDVVLIDTAGRMHTKSDLLREMEKISRVTKPNLKVFVAEAIAGNDAIEQAKTFNEIMNLDGSILSKADVDEKGGTIISISYITKKPIFYLGVGQNYNDLELFNKEKILEKLGL